MEEDNSEVGEFDQRREDPLGEGELWYKEAKSFTNFGKHMNHFSALLKAESDATCWGRVEDFAFLTQIPDDVEQQENILKGQ